MDVLETLKKLPAECYSTLPSNPRQLIGIHRGVPGYTPLKIHDTTAQADEQVERMNAARGVTAAQLEAMIIGSQFGWHVPGADPDLYAK